eukprot:TRINITY_DN2644_c0_g1_i12.p1 TRINITY_DN2644_c0_g1~~TRINITY_DN2644_c0_g1_i12.p1  ORF type:complete len:175 (+),score=22.46 TRINITY_DN2644_c0_g1_i12:246-770(+)
MNPMFAREKQQVLDGLRGSKVSLRTYTRVAAFTKHEVCDSFVQQCCDYIDTFFAIQKHAMRDEKINKLQWGALGRPSNTQRIKLPSPRVQNLRERQSAGNAQQTRTPRAPRAQRNAQLAEQLEQQLVDLSRSYLWILFNFGDFAKPIEVLCFSDAASVRLTPKCSGSGVLCFCA